MRHLKYILLFLLLPNFLIAQNHANDIYSGKWWEDCRAYDDFNTAITDIGATAVTLMIVDNETVSSNVTVPATMNLLFLGGGKLTFAAGITVTINSGIMTDEWTQRFAQADYDNPANVTINGLNQMNPALWGATDLNDEADSTLASNNTLAFREAWNSAGRKLFYVPEGNFVLDSLGSNCVGWDDIGLGSFVGAGPRVSNLMLHDGVTRNVFFDLKNTHPHNTVFENFSIIGNSNATFDTLFMFYTYNGTIRDVNIRNHVIGSGAVALSVRGQQFNLINVESEFNDIGIELSQVYHAELIGCSVESDSIGILVNGNLGNREAPIISIHNLYAESTTFPVKIEGASGVVLHPWYGGGTIQIETDASGNVSSNNVIYGIGVNGAIVTIDSGCVDNTVYVESPTSTSEGLLLVDDENVGEYNIIRRASLLSGLDVPIYEDYSGSYYAQNTNPATVTVTRDSSFVRSGSVYLEELAYIENAAGDTMATHLEIKADDNPTFNVALNTIPNDTVVYIYVLLQGQPSAEITISAQDLTANPDSSYDFKSDTWVAGTGAGHKFAPTGGLQYIRLRCVTNAAQDPTRLNIAFGTYTNILSNRVRLYYVNVSTNERAGLTHIVGSTTVGFGLRGPAYFTTATLPKAWAMPTGTTVFNSDSLYSVVSTLADSTWRNMVAVIVRDDGN